MAQITLNSTGVASNGALVLQSNGTTTAVTIDTSQRAAFVAGTAALPAITTTGDTNTGIFFPAADTIAFSEGGVEAARIDSSGNLGLGVTPSAISQGRALQVLTQGYGLWNGSGSPASIYLTANTYFDSSFKYGETGPATTYYQYQGTHVWNTATSGTAGNAITFTQAMTLDASGNLGVNATTPSTYGKLVVSGGGFTQLATTALPATSGSTRSDFTRILDSAGSRSLDSSISSTGAWIQSRDKNDYSVNYDLFLQPNGGNFGIGTTSLTEKFEVNGSINSIGQSVGFGTGAQRAFMDYTSATTTARFGHLSGASGSTTGVMSFFTNGTERARIDSSGALLVGATVLTPQTGKFKVVHDTGNQNIATSINSAASNPYGDVILFSGASPNNGTNYFLLCADSTINRAIIYSNGGLANYSANNSNLSDRREKTNFAPAKSYLDVICSIPVQTFNYIDQNLEDDGGLTLGVVAQDVQAVAPELVMESNWAKEGDAPKMRLSIYQTDLQYALMKCIQEQQALITQLTARLDAANL